MIISPELTLKKPNAICDKAAAFTSNLFTPWALIHSTQHTLTVLCTVSSSYDKMFSTRQKTQYFLFILVCDISSGLLTNFNQCADQSSPQICLFVCPSLQANLPQSADQNQYTTDVEIKQNENSLMVIFGCSGNSYEERSRINVSTVTENILKC